MAPPYASAQAQLEACLDRAQRLLTADVTTFSYGELVDTRVAVKSLTERLREFTVTEAGATAALAGLIDDGDAMFEALVRRADGYGAEAQLASDAAGAAAHRLADRHLTACPHCGSGELYLDDSADLALRSPRYAALGVRLVVCGECGLLRLQARDGAVRTMVRALGLRRLDVSPRGAPR